MKRQTFLSIAKNYSQRKGTDRITEMKSNLGTLSFLLCFVLTITNFRETGCITGQLPSGKRNTVTFHVGFFFLKTGFKLKYYIL